MLEAKNFRILTILGATDLYGSEKGIIRTIEIMKECGADVYVITNKKWGYEYIDEFVDKFGFTRSGALFGPLMGRNMIYNPLDILSVIKGIIFTSISVAKAIRNFRPTHIYIANVLYLEYSFFALIFCKIPIIYRLGDLIPKGLHGIFFKRVITKKVTCFACISNFTKNHGLERGIPEEKLVVIYNLPTLDKEILPQKEKFIYRKNSDQIVITFLGQHHIYKGLHLFVDAAIEYVKERDDVLFYTAGDYAYKNPFAVGELKKIKDLGLENKIIFLGYIKNPHLLLKESDIHCAPSIFEEPLGNVVLEAKVAGIPSVIFQSGGLPEMIEHRVDGYICRERTKEGLKEGISYFLDNRNFLEEAKKNAFASLKKFEHRMLGDKWIEILRQTLK